MTRTTTALRIVIGLSLVLFASGVGYLQRSWWSLPFLAAGFTAAYIGGKARAWRALVVEGPGQAIFIHLPVTFAMQLALVGVLYLSGFGLGALVQGEVALQAWSSFDAVVPVAIGVCSAGLAFVIQRMEHEVRVSDLLQEWNLSRMEKEDEGASDPQIR